MAKMFYTLEEAAEKLGIAEDEVKELAAQGQLQQFRDRDKLMFKRDQVDALSTGDSDASATGGFITIEDEEDAVPLDADDSGGAVDPSATDAISLPDDTEVDGEPPIDVDSGTEDAPSEPAGQRTGISVFDADELEEQADPLAQTQVTGAQVDEEELALESVGSGSGLLDLTRESDDTSLGAELLDEIYPSSGPTDATPSEMDGGGGFGGGSFDQGGFDSGGSGGGGVPAAAPAGGADTFDPAMLDLSDTGASGLANIPSASGLDNLQDQGPTASGLDNLAPQQDFGMQAGMPAGNVATMGGAGGGMVDYAPPVSDLGSNVFGVLTLLFAIVVLSMGMIVAVSSIMAVPVELTRQLADKNVLMGLVGGGFAWSIIMLIVGVVLSNKK